MLSKQKKQRNLTSLAAVGVEFIQQHSEYYSWTVILPTDDKHHYKTDHTSRPRTTFVQASFHWVSFPQTQARWDFYSLFFALRVSHWDYLDDRYMQKSSWGTLDKHLGRRSMSGLSHVPIWTVTCNEFTCIFPGSDIASYIMHHVWLRNFLYVFLWTMGLIKSKILEHAKKIHKAEVSVKYGQHFFFSSEGQRLSYIIMITTRYGSILLVFSGCFSVFESMEAKNCM